MKYLFSWLVAFAFCVQAQGQYAIDWFKISGGGGASTGGVYTVAGTIGQPDAGAAMNGGNYSVTGGFWSLISVVQTAGAPTLSITRAGKSVTVSWQNVGSWNLLQNSSLANAGGWTTNTSWTTSNGTNSLTIVNPTSAMFFRLHQ